MREDPGGLDKRKAYILATVVYEYIATAEPVGSQTLTQKYQLGVSSATVRNEMAELEAGGYLVQPHTSAGRVPSDAGYREYVDRLMDPEELSLEDRRRIHDELRDASHELDELVESTTRLLGRLSNNLAFVTKPYQLTETFKHIQLIWLSPRTGVAIVVTTLGVAAQSLFETSDDLLADDLTRLSNALNGRFADRPLLEVTDAAVGQVSQRAGAADDLRVAVTDRAGIGAFDGSPADCGCRRAKLARPTRVSRSAEVAFDFADCRRAENAVSNRCRRNVERVRER